MDTLFHNQLRGHLRVHAPESAGHHLRIRVRQGQCGVQSHCVWVEVGWDLSMYIFLIIIF